MAELNSFVDYFRKRYGARLQKVVVDAGFTCPNRDGSKGVGGCSFCLNDAFHPNYCTPDKPIHQQIDEGIEFHTVRYRHAQRYIAYFQPYSNTYAPVEKLRELYATALSHPLIEGIVVGTRPDCVDAEKLDLLQSIQEGTFNYHDYAVEGVPSESGTADSDRRPVVSDGRTGVSESGADASEGGTGVSESGADASEGRSGVSESGVVVSDGKPGVSESGVVVSDGRTGISESGVAVSDGRTGVSESGVVDSEDGAVVSGGGKKIVIVEYGIESCYDKTLRRINRCHDFECARKAVEETARRGLTQCAHFIFGLPGESLREMMDEAEIINSLPVTAVKFHQLQIIRGTRMEKEFELHRDEFHEFTLDGYLDFMADFISRLRSDIYIDRFAGEVPPRFLSPLQNSWGLVRYQELLAMLRKRMSAG